MSSPFILYSHIAGIITEPDKYEAKWKTEAVLKKYDFISKYGKEVFDYRMAVAGANGRNNPRECEERNIRVQMLDMFLFDLFDDWEPYILQLIRKEKLPWNRTTDGKFALASSNVAGTNYDLIDQMKIAMFENGLELVQENRKMLGIPLYPESGWAFLVKESKKGV